MLSLYLHYLTVKLYNILSKLVNLKHIIKPITNQKKTIKRYKQKFLFFKLNIKRRKKSHNNIYIQY